MIDNPDPLQRLWVAAGRSQKSVWILVGSTASLVVGAASAIFNLPQVATLVLLALSIPTFTVVILHLFFVVPIDSLKAQFESTSLDLKRQFDSTIQDIIIRRFDDKALRSLADRTISAGVAWDLCQPIIDKTLFAVQKGSPVPTELNLSYTVAEFEPDNPIVGRRIRVDIAHDWIVKTPQKDSFLRDLLPPTFLCHSAALLMTEVVKLQTDGFADLLWPIPSDWLDSDESTPFIELKHLSELRELPWYRIQEMDIDRVQHFTDIRISNDSTTIERVFKEAWARGRVGSPPSDLVTKFLSLCLAVVHIPNNVRVVSHSNAAPFAFHISMKGQYWVLVERREPQERLYRYDIPFVRPAFVSSITFALADAEESTEDPVRGRWSLLRAIERCAFDLSHQSKIDDPTRQSLRWDIPDALRRDHALSGVPFLPGHGVTFMWGPKDGATATLEAPRAAR